MGTTVTTLRVWKHKKLKAKSDISSTVARIEKAASDGDLKASELTVKKGDKKHFPVLFSHSTYRGTDKQLEFDYRVVKNASGDKKRTYQAETNFIAIDKNRNGKYDPKVDVVLRLKLDDNILFLSEVKKPAKLKDIQTEIGKYIYLKDKGIEDLSFTHVGRKYLGKTYKPRFTNGKHIGLNRVLLWATKYGLVHEKKLKSKTQDKKFDESTSQFIKNKLQTIEDFTNTNYSHSTNALIQFVMQHPKIKLKSGKEIETYNLFSFENRGTSFSSQVDDQITTILNQFIRKK